MASAENWDDDFDLGDNKIGATPVFETSDEAADVDCTDSDISINDIESCETSAMGDQQSINTSLAIPTPLKSSQREMIPP